MTDRGDKPEKPDPFAPLPLADLPPVRGKETSGPIPRVVKKDPSGATRGDTMPGATPVLLTPPATATPVPTTEAGEIDADELRPAGGDFAAGGLASEPVPPPPSVEVAPDGPVWETPAGSSWANLPPAAPDAWTETQPPAPAPAPVAAETLLPPAYNDAELRDALGVTPRVEPEKKPKKAKKSAPPPRDDADDGDDGDGPRRSRKGMFVGALAIVMGGGIAAMVLLGKANAEHYYLTCEADQVVVEQGRSFPPWGSSTLGGAEWKPLKIPPETVCVPRETDSYPELAGWYMKVLTDFASKQLSARDATRVDESEAILKQALLVSRVLPAESAKDARGEIDRLLGDVTYWRATARLKSAAEALADAAKQFDAAAAARPEHFKDSAEWAKHTRELAERLRAGPGGVPSVALPPAAAPERPSAPPGVALPVEPDASDAGSAAPAPTPAPAPSSGVMI